MKLNNSLWQTVADCIYNLLPVSRFEKKLRASTRYRHDSVTRWKRHFGLSASITNRILKNIEIFDGNRIHQLIKDTVQARADVFNAENCYVAPFGPVGKSGHNIFYEFCHAVPVGDRAKQIWECPSLPSESRIIFVDDLVGSGSQSLEYIHTKMGGVLNSSHKPCLFSVCGTPTGIERVRRDSTFEVICANILEESIYSFYSEYNKVFSDEEKAELKRLNISLGETPFFGMGLLVAFFYTTPDNTMPLLWNNNAEYADSSGVQKRSYALFPRTTHNP